MTDLAPRPRQGDSGVSFSCCFHYTEAVGFEPFAPGASPKCLKPARTSAGWDRHSLQRGIPGNPDRTHARSSRCGECWPARGPRCQISAPDSRAPRGAPHQKLDDTHHKREGERLPGGIAGAGRSCTPRRAVCSRRRPLRGARATPKMPAGSPGPGARPHRRYPAAAPPLPGRVAWSWSVLGEVGARARREGARGRVGVGQRLPARIPGRAKARAVAVLKLRAGPRGRRVPSSGLTGRASASGPWRALRLPRRPGRTQW